MAHHEKLPKKLGSHTMYNFGLKFSIQGCLYNSQTCEESEKSWERLIHAYKLEDNAWLSGLYSKHSFWVPIFLKDVLWVEMSTTHRSESMNAFFYDFLHSGTTLKEFVDQSDNSLKKKLRMNKLLTSPHAMPQYYVFHLLP